MECRKRYGSEYSRGCHFQLTPCTPKKCITPWHLGDVTYWSTLRHGVTLTSYTTLMATPRFRGVSVGKLTSLSKAALLTSPHLDRLVKPLLFMSPQRRQRSLQVQWTQTETELLIAWMEDNRDDLHFKQNAWHKAVYVQVFSTYEHITVNKIKDKVKNMKRSWQAARAMADNSGWGVENQSESINKVLERKCPFYWRLDELWGSHPNATAIMDTESSHMTSHMTPQVPPQVPSQVPSHEIHEIQDESDIEWDDLDWSLSPTPPPAPHSSIVTSRSAISRSSTLRSSTSGLPKRKEKQDLALVMKRAFEER